MEIGSLISNNSQIYSLDKINSIYLLLSLTTPHYLIFISNINYSNFIYFIHFFITYSFPPIDVKYKLKLITSFNIL